MGYRDYSVAKGLIVDASGHGDFTTWQAAINAATPGQDIFIRSGTYTEDPILKAGITISAFDGDSDTPTVTLIGKMTFSVAGSVSIGSIRLQTNSDFFLVVSGSSASSVILDDCYFNCTNHTGISFTSSSASSQIASFQCNGALRTTGIAWYSSSSPGGMTFTNLNAGNASSTTPSTNSAGVVNLVNCSIGSSFSTSGTGGIGVLSSGIDSGTQNATSVTANGTGPHNFRNSFFGSGTASAISVGTGATVVAATCVINSSNTNAITGLGTLNYGALTFTTSSGINTSTLVPLVTLPAGSSNITTIDGDTGSATPTAGVINLHAANNGASLLFSATGSTVTFRTTDSNDNIFFGGLSGNSSLTGLENTFMGFSSGNSLTGGNFNCGYGLNSMLSATTGSNCVAIGMNSLERATNPTKSTALGFAALSNILAGDSNISIGYNAGLGYIGSESSNIIIANFGTASESNVIRIGTQGSGSGQQNSCFIAGIAGVSVSNLNAVTINTSTGQLGSQSVASLGAVTTINGDSGSATPTAGAITISGGGIGLTTSASGSTVNLTGTLNVSHGGTAATSFNTNGAVISNTTSTGALAAVSLASQQFLVGNSGAPTAKAFSVNNQVFASTGTYTPTLGMVYCEVMMLGGGGAGGGAAATGGTTNSIGGGGGAGEYAVGVFSAATIGASQSVTIGAAGVGASGTTGGSGGTTSLGALMTAVGGSGGVTAAAATLGNVAGASGGTGGTGGSYRSNGYAGGFGLWTGANQIVISGAGANSQIGMGGANLAGTTATGNAAAIYGAGGGGAIALISQTAQTGGAGSKGVVIITEYIIS